MITRTEIGRLAEGEVPLFVFVDEAPADTDPGSSKISVDNVNTDLGRPSAVMLPCVEISDGVEAVYLSADDTAYLAELLARSAHLLRMIARTA